MNVLSVVLSVILICTGTAGCTGKTGFNKNEQNINMHMPFTEDDKNIYYAIPDGNGEWQIKNIDKKNGNISIISTVPYSPKIYTYDNKIIYVGSWNDNYGVFEINKNGSGKINNIISFKQSIYNDYGLYINEKYNHLYINFEGIQKINKDGSTATDLGINAKYISIYDDNIYFGDENLNLYKSDLDGQNQEIIISKQKILECVYDEGTRYLCENGGKIMQVVKSNNKLFFLISQGAGLGGKLIYYDMVDDEVNQLQTNTIVREFQIIDNTMYLIGNDKTREMFWSVNLTTQETKILKYFPVYSFCISENKIYYLKSVNEHVKQSVYLYSMNLDGTDEILIDSYTTQ